MCLGRTGTARSDTLDRVFLRPFRVSLLDELRELVGAAAPALVEAHLLVRLAVGDGPVAHAGGEIITATAAIASLTPLVREASQARIATRRM